LYINPKIFVRSEDRDFNYEPIFDCLLTIPYIFKLASFKGKSKDVHNNAPYIIMTDKSHDIGNNHLL
ncbi:hypothetical protein, partial [Phocaeicola vulgatus]|uniref:hypothetical protein n=1 Tax=Phocaeicola vulgatus TaxID=821 RepID=UPI001E589B45